MLRMRASRQQPLAATSDFDRKYVHLPLVQTSSARLALLPGSAQAGAQWISSRQSILVAPSANSPLNPSITQLVRMIGAAVQAPSAVNEQPRCFVVVGNRDLFPGVAGGLCSGWVERRDGDSTLRA